MRRSRGSATLPADGTMEKFRQRKMIVVPMPSPTGRIRPVPVMRLEVRLAPDPTAPTVHTNGVWQIKGFLIPGTGKAAFPNTRTIRKEAP